MNRFLASFLVAVFLGLILSPFHQREQEKRIVPRDVRFTVGQTTVDTSLEVRALPNESGGVPVTVRSGNDGVEIQFSYNPTTTSVIPGKSNQAGFRKIEFRSKTDSTPLLLLYRICKTEECDGCWRVNIHPKDGSISDRRIDTASALQDLIDKI